jgi:hypothetical protein
MNGHDSFWKPVAREQNVHGYGDVIVPAYVTFFTPTAYQLHNAKLYWACL